MSDNNKSEPATKVDLQELEQKLTGKIVQKILRLTWLGLKATSATSKNAWQHGTT